MRMGPDEVWGGEARENKVVLNVMRSSWTSQWAMSEHGEMRWWQIGTCGDCWSVTPSSASVPRSNTFQLHHHSSSEAWNFWWATLLPAWAGAVWWHGWQVLSQVGSLTTGSVPWVMAATSLSQTSNQAWRVWGHVSGGKISQVACDQRQNTVHSFMESSKLGPYTAVGIARGQVSRASMRRLQPVLFLGTAAVSYGHLGHSLTVVLLWIWDLWISSLPTGLLLPLESREGKMMALQMLIITLNTRSSRVSLSVAGEFPAEWVGHEGKRAFLFSSPGAVSHCPSACTPVAHFLWPHFNFIHSLRFMN